MSNPNIYLSWWQLTLMAVVPVVMLAGWLIACFIAAREPRSHAAAAGLGLGQAAAGPATGTSASVQDEPALPAPPERRLAA